MYGFNRKKSHVLYGLGRLAQDLGGTPRKLRDGMVHEGFDCTIRLDFQIKFVLRGRYKVSRQPRQLVR